MVLKGPLDLVSLGRGVLVTLMLMCGSLQMAALKTAVGYKEGTGGFTALVSTVDKLVGYIQVLGISLGALGLVVAGLMLMTGQQEGMQWGTRAAVGIVLALSAPGIVA